MAGVTDSWDFEDVGAWMRKAAEENAECKREWQATRAEVKVTHAEVEKLTEAIGKLQEAQAADDEARAKREAESSTNRWWLNALLAVLIAAASSALALALDYRSRTDRLEVQVSTVRQAGDRHERELEAHEDSPGHAGNRADIGAIRGDIRELGATVRSLTEAVRETQEDVRELRRRVR